MLEKLSSDQFTPIIGDTFTFVIANGPDIDVTLAQVKEKPESKNPDAGDDVRTPFSLFFKGEENTGSELCAVDLRHPNFPGDLLNIHITQVLPPETEIPEAWYQAIFC